MGRVSLSDTVIYKMYCIISMKDSCPSSELYRVSVNGFSNFGFLLLRATLCYTYITHAN
jgi:hypothetical protein